MAKLPTKRFEAHWKQDATETTQALEIHHVYDAFPKQVTFHQTRKMYLCFGGARGPGKTHTLCQHIYAAMVQWPGIPILLLRKDLKDLKLTTEVEWQIVCEKELYDPKYGGQYHKGERWYQFPNGSKLMLGELKDWESYKSATVGMIVIDECNEVDEDAVINLAPTLRWTSGEGVCDYPECAALGPEFAREHPRHPFYQIVMATNPSPGWVKKRFYEPYKVGVEKPNHAFIAATAFDNPALPPSFIPNLMENNNATWVQNYIYGRWEAFENMVWPHIQRPTHTWHGPIPERDIARVVGGIDYGATSEEAHRTCAYLIALLRGGQKVTFWEYSKQGAASTDFFEAITIATRQHKVDRWAADASQHRANELLRDMNIPVFDAPSYKGSVMDGVNQVHRMTTPNATGDPELLVTAECTRLWSGIETYQMDKEKGEPKKNQEDDEVNAWRYAVMEAKQMSAGQRIEVRSTDNAAVSSQKTSRLMEKFKNEKRDRIRKLVEAQNRG